jgi:hypothetical protein
VKYISLNDLSRELDLTIDTDSDEFLKLPNVINRPDFTDIKLFLENQSPQNRVFIGWIEQHKPFKELLISGISSDYFEDKYNWKQHFLYSEFKSYVSPFFEELVKRKNETQINSEWAKIFSFFELLIDDTRLYIEQTLYQNIKNTIEHKLSETTKNISEEDFHQILLFVLSDDCIAIHNSLSRSSHSFKISFVEQILKLFYHPKCSAKIGHWMILRLEKMTLNSEQNQSLEQIKIKIKSGKIQFSKTEVQKSSSRLKNITLLFLVLSSLGLFVFFYQQDYTVSQQNFKEHSSLSYFSIRERIEIDSIFKSMTNSILDSINEDLLSTGSFISIRQPIKNKLAEKIYKELEFDMTNHFLRVYDTCNPISINKLQEENINQTRKLKSIKANCEIEFKNDSEYSFVVLAWKENVNGEVYSGVISKNSTFSFMAIKGMRLILLPGTEYGAIPPSNRAEFNYLINHFCGIDFNYEFALQEIYTVDKTHAKVSKILIEGYQGDIVTITDVNGILTK